MPAEGEMETDLAQTGGDSEENKKKIFEAMNEVANVQYMDQKYQLALYGYNVIIELCPDNAKYYGNRAACYMMLQQYQKAFQDAKKCVELDPACSKAYIRLVKCSLILGDTATARYELDRLIKANSNTKTIGELRVQLDYVEDHYKKAKAAYEAGLYRKAIFHLKMCCVISTACTKFKVKMAECWVLLEKYQYAENIVNDILHLDRQNVDALYIRGICLYYQDNIDKGIAYFQQVLRLAPDHKAIKLYKTAKKIKFMKEEGNVAFDKDNYQLAYDCYTEALTVDPNNNAINAKLYFNRATTAAMLGLIEDSIKDSTAALNLNESYLKPLLLRARSYMLLKEYDKAVIDLEKVCKLKDTREHRRKLLEAKSFAEGLRKKDYYNILGINKNATMNDVKKAYKTKARLHHPDRHAIASEGEKKKQEVKFKEILEAYNILSDPQSRLRYDMSDGTHDFDPGFYNGAPNDMFQSFFGQQRNYRRHAHHFTTS